MANETRKGTVLKYDAQAGLGQVKVNGQTHQFVTGSYLPGAGHPEPKEGDGVSVELDARGNVLGLVAEKDGWD